MNSDEPLVSIIIPSYNAEKYIAETIGSALAQTWANKEIIVIDNNSSDKSFEIASDFAERGLIALYEFRKAGATAARNFGFEKSSGEYIQYLDADDLLSPNKIASQVQLLSKHPGNFISSCAWGKFQHSVEQVKFVENYLWHDADPVDWLVSAWKDGGMMQTACWLTSRHLIEAAGPWDESLIKNPNDDGEFFCRVILQSEGIRYSNEGKVYYREYTGERVSNADNVQAVQSLFLSYHSYEKNIFLKEKSDRTRIAVAQNYLNFIYQYHVSYPAEADRARQFLAALNIGRLPEVGGSKFSKLKNLVGFENALKLKVIFGRLLR